MSENNRGLATLGGGCFWCLEAVFEQVIGVVSVVSGYCGGHADNPTYRVVCDGDSGHAEVVRISFDPGLISYENLLEIFFVIHDPTTLNRQGNDSGSQYRSVIFHHSAAQRETAISLMRRFEAEKLWDAPIVTEVQPEALFYAAEDYHQHYFRKNPDKGYCQMIVAPKVAKFRKSFRALIRRNS